MKAVGGLRRPPHVAAVASLEHARLIDDPSGSAAKVASSPYATTAEWISRPWRPAKKAGALSSVARNAAPSTPARSWINLSGPIISGV
jgi:hypothetical protein